MKVLFYLNIINNILLSYSIDIEKAIQNTYKGFIENNINKYDIKLVHRPYSEYPEDIVSEGVGYGMLISVWNNDEKTFKDIYKESDKYMWTGEYYNWHIGKNGEIMGTGAATDAEEDIAMGLILAIKKIEKLEWDNEMEIKYRERLQNILDNMWTKSMISDKKLICPGSGWGCNQFLNPSYFAPAWYRIFSEIDENQYHDWESVIEINYDILMKTEGYDNGIIPDWTTIDGNFLEYEGQLGYNTYANGQYFYKDAIRVLWRIGLDYLWFKEERAKILLENSYEFIKGNASKANFYRVNEMDLVPEEDVWIFDGNKKMRTRREHSHLTLGMWSIPIYIFGTEREKELLLEEWDLFYKEGQLFWGKIKDEINNEDIEHNEMYFDQFMALFGTMIMNNQCKRPI